MTGFHSPWPLFCNDQDLARSWLRPQLQGFVLPDTGHLAISLGLTDTLLHNLRTGVLQANASSVVQWRFRVARLHGEANPYRHLLPVGRFEQTLSAIAQSKRNGVPLSVRLNGGIGDHLEALSLLLPWSRAEKQSLNLEMSTERQHQIEPLLTQWPQVQCEKRHELGSASIPAMALRAAVVESPQPTNYSALLLQEKAMQPIQRNWLCCWRAEGAGDRLSAHSRSVPLVLAQEFYRHLQRVHPERCIVDITNWKDWEASQLKRMGIEVLDPRQGTLLELINRCQVSHVITIDTALVHLCAAAGQQANLLLSAFPDERWQELHRPTNHYGQLIKLWRSSQFGSWSAVLSSLTASLCAEG